MSEEGEVGCHDADDYLEACQSLLGRGLGGASPTQAKVSSVTRRAREAGRDRGCDMADGVSAWLWDVLWIWRGVDMSGSDVDVRMDQ
jgi:hypothetical protein